MNDARQITYGQKGTNYFEKLGIYLSLRMIRKHLPKSKTLHVLDVGCGYHARFLNGLLPNISSAVGIDFKVSDANKRIPQFSFVEMPAEKALPTLTSETFDVIIMNNTLEHFWEPLQILAEAYRLLTPTGLLLVNVPNWLGKVTLEFVAFRLDKDPSDEMDDHKMYYDIRDLWPLLVRVGFLPRQIKMTYHKFGLSLFAAARKTTSNTN
jgi:Methylase involved in ubiquinone/menaquinone biosynthesis